MLETKAQSVLDVTRSHHLGLLTFQARGRQDCPALWGLVGQCDQFRPTGCELR